MAIPAAAAAALPACGATLDSLWHRALLCCARQSGSRIAGSPGALNHTWRRQSCQPLCHGHCSAPRRLSFHLGAPLHTHTHTHSSPRCAGGPGERAGPGQVQPAGGAAQPQPDVHAVPHGAGGAGLKVSPPPCWLAGCPPACRGGSSRAGCPRAAPRAGEAGQPRGAARAGAA